MNRLVGRITEMVLDWLTYQFTLSFFYLVNAFFVLTHFGSLFCCSQFSLCFRVVQWSMGLLSIKLFAETIFVWIKFHQVEMMVIEPSDSKQFSTVENWWPIRMVWKWFFGLAPVNIVYKLCDNQAGVVHLIGFGKFFEFDFPWFSVSDPCVFVVEWELFANRTQIAPKIYFKWNIPLTPISAPCLYQEQILCKW